MARKKRGNYRTFIAMSVTEAEGPLERTEIQYWGGLYLKTVKGSYPPGADKFYNYLVCADGFEWTLDAESEMLLLCSAFPHLIGKVFLTTKFVPETELEKKRRLSEQRARREMNRARREAWKAANGGSSGALGSTSASGPTTDSSTSSP